MSSDDKKRDQMLDKMNEVMAKPPEQLPAPKTEAQQQFDSDYEYTRKKLKNLVDIGEDALENFLEIAKETNEPRAFEVVAQLLKNTGELTKGIIENAKQKSTIDKETSSGVSGDDKPKSLTQNNQTIYVGSTKELADLIKKGDLPDIEQ